MTFSLGLGPTKTLAKVASKWKKPAGFTVISSSLATESPSAEIETFLREVPIGAVWGIGKSMSAHMQTLGIKTALEFTEKSETYIQEYFSKPTQELCMSCVV